MAHRRNRGHSPSDSHQPSLIVNLDTNNNNGGSPNRKVHGRRAAVIVAAGANKKHVYVIIGSLCVVALCLVGMWASDSTMDVGSRGTRQIDQRMAGGSSSSSDRRSSTTRRKKKRGTNHKHLPKGIGQRDHKDYFRNPQDGGGSDGVEVLKLPPIGGIRQQDILVDGSTDKSKNSNEDADAALRLTIQNPLEDEPWIQKEKEDGSEEQEESDESESAAKQSKIKSASPDEEETVKSKEEEDSNDNNQGRHSKKSEDEEEEDDSKEEGTDVADKDKGGEDEESASEDNNAPSTSTYQPRVVSLHFEALSNDVSNNRNKRRHSRSHHNEHNHDTRADVAGPNKYKNVLLTKVGRMPVYNNKDKRPIDEDEDEESDRFINPYPDDDQYFDRVEKVKQSKKYRRNEREPLEDKECKPRHEWQAGAFPNCNILHEFELGQLSGMFGRALRKKLRKAEGEGEELVKYLAHGYWRDVWLVSKSSTTFDAESTEQQQQQHIGESEYDEEITVLKTLRYKHDFTDRNYDRHRKDALASERLSNSPNVVDIFAYCSNSAVFEYGPGGDIEGKLWPYDDEEDKYYVADIPSLEKLDMAYQVARGIADMHDVEDDGYASIAHTDITPSQFIYINGRWKMNDFNRCRFMRVYKDDKKPCGFHVGANPGKFRAPEEYNYEEENEMIDVYSMGNIFYAIIAGEMPFEGQKESKAQKKVMDGTRPTIPDEVLESKDIAIKTLVSATRKCWEQKPENRPSAASVRDEFKRVLDRIKKNNVTKDS